jgi:hypothetical protein
MAKTTKAPLTTKLRRNLWPIVAIASLALNVGLVGGYEFLLHYNQAPLIQSEISVRCNEPGYSRMINEYKTLLLRDGGRTEDQITKNLKFASASLCFTDYETGKAVDLDSIKPQPNGNAYLPAKP